jgi:NRAMP (natural resistance-associated macrophage protein)-like metal ion transporter
MEEHAIKEANKQPPEVDVPEPTQKTGKGDIIRPGGSLANLRQRIRRIALVEQLGPGIITGAADDDPSGIATYSQAGAQFGNGLLWTLVLTYPFMTAIQLVSARVGRVTGNGLAANMRGVMPEGLVTSLVALLFLANTINIGADVAAMGEAAQLVFGWGANFFTFVFAAVSLLLQMFVAYRRYSQFLKWLTLVLFSYVAVLCTVRIDWSSALQDLVWPSHSFDARTATAIVAIFGTTISPYMFFWQSAQEVEEVSADPEAKPLKQAPRQATTAFSRIKFDTFFGMAMSNLIAIAIVLTTAATLHAHGKTNIATAADAAQALQPLAGRFAFLLFSLGIIGTGLLAVPVLAGSAAYAVGESRGWKCGLDRKPWEAIGFYSVIAVATGLGLGIDYSGIDPIKALYWSAVINGVIAVPIMVAMMYVVGKPRQMGKFTASLRLKIFGWASAGVMAAATIAMIVMNIAG